MKYKLIYKDIYAFVYEKKEEEGYVHRIDIVAIDTENYKGVQVNCNSDGYNNAVGIRREELLRLPFWILHFKLYRLIKGFGKDKKED